ncbi:Telomere Length Regulation Protein Tel2 [Manis pentadactyla]|nr:Telomere Length Regulation Protein Tel2 [Manis pentadactyla]
MHWHPQWLSEGLLPTGAASTMSYFVDSSVSGPGPYAMVRPAVVRQGPINSYEDPRIACGFQSSYYPQRACYRFWDEMATQEVPTGLEHCGSEIELQVSKKFTDICLADIPNL